MYRGRPRPMRHRRPLVFWAVVVALIAVVGTLFYVLVLAPPVVVSGSVTIASGPPMHLAPTFWAADMQGDPSTPQILQFFESTPIRWIRGINMEGYDAITGLAYAKGGGTVPWTTNVTDWKTFCESLGCHMIVTLPAEVNDTAIDLADVAYLETNYSFVPDYYALGNEPQGWANFNQPFSPVPITNPVRVTLANAPLAGYVVNREAGALKQHYPGIQLIGIQSATCANDQFLSAFAIQDSLNTEVSSCHMYPNGISYGGVSVDQFLSSDTVGRLASSVAGTRAALAAACATCAQPLWITEFNSAEGGAFSPYMLGWPEVPFVAAQFVQLVQIGEPMFSFFEVACSGSAFDLLGPGCAMTPTASLYAQVFSAFRTGSMENASFSGAMSGLYLLEGQSASGESLLVVNTNTRVTADLTSLGTFPVAGGVSEVSGTPASGFQDTSYSAGQAPSSWSVPPQGVLLLNTGA